MQAAHGECPKVRPRLCYALCAIKPPANFDVNATFFNETPKGPIEGLPLMGPFFIIYALDLPSVFEKKSIHMSTRNPMNDRYQTDGPKGQTQEICLVAQAEVESRVERVREVHAEDSSGKESCAKGRSPKAGRARPPSITIRLRLSTKSTSAFGGACSAALSSARWSPWALAPGGPITRL